MWPDCRSTFTVPVAEEGSVLVGACKNWRVNVFSAETSLGIMPVVCAAENAVVNARSSATRVRARVWNIEWVPRKRLAS